MKATWKTLKDGWGRVMTKRNQISLRSGSGSGKLPTCQFFEQLLFLGDKYQATPTISTFQPRQISTPVRQSPDESVDDPTPRYREVSKKHKPNNSEKIEREILKSLKSVNDQINAPTTNVTNVSSAPPKQEESSNMTFCKSLAPLMGELTSEQAMIARIKMQQVLYEIKFNKSL